MAEHTTNYFDTLIEPSPDCPAGEGKVPSKPGTVAAMQYQQLSEAPYKKTSDDLIFDIFAERNDVPASEREAARKAFFSKGQPCLRSSPLVKTYGWSLHYDKAGRVALYGAETAQFRELAERDSVTKLKGMRSHRAK